MTSTPAAPPAPVQPLSPGTSAQISALFANAVEAHRTAGITWAIVGGHDHAQEVLAAGGAGHHRLEGGVPAPGSPAIGPGSISRIASMTKSFTAASVLRLRDEGALRLDDPIAQHVPEATAIAAATPDSPEITVRDLLTMSAGLVTDNPWGDRQEAMTREDFARMLAEGLGHVHAPGTGFEYSNTGYALLGRLIDEVSGTGYDEYVRTHFLAPLGMGDSAFRPDDLDPARIATGHRLGDREDATRFEPVGLDRPGVYGAMAGIYSTTADIARWVRFLAAADAPDAAERSQDLLRTASRREMQQLHRIQQTAPLPPVAPAGGADGAAAAGPGATTSEGAAPAAGAGGTQALGAAPAGEPVSPGFDRVRGYGFGLVIERFPDLGEVVSHSGGYPGYGSFMVWHRDSGLGVVALANSKYAPASSLAMEALRLIRRLQPELLAPRGRIAAPRTLEAAQAALAWLSAPEDSAADAWFADNMDLDTSREERLRRRDAALGACGLGLEAIEGLTPAGAQVLSRAALRWTVPGTVEGTSLRVDLEMDPRSTALIQTLETRALR